MSVVYFAASFYMSRKCVNALVSSDSTYYNRFSFSPKLCININICPGLHDSVPLRVIVNYNTVHCLKPLTKGYHYWIIHCKQVVEYIVWSFLQVCIHALHVSSYPYAKNSALYWEVCSCRRVPFAVVPIMLGCMKEINWCLALSWQPLNL